MATDLAIWVGGAHSHSVLEQVVEGSVDFWVGECEVALLYLVWGEMEGIDEDAESFTHCDSQEWLWDRERDNAFP